VIGAKCHPERNNIIRLSCFCLCLGILIVITSGCSAVLPVWSETSPEPGNPVLTTLYAAGYEPAPAKKSQANHPTASIQPQSTVKKAEQDPNNNNQGMIGRSGGFTLAGTVFFDRDADGIRAGGEPGIGSIQVCLHYPERTVCTPSGPDGSFSFEDLPGGALQLLVENKDQARGSLFRYRVESSGYVDVPAYYINGRRVAKQLLPDGRVSPIQDPFELEVTADTILELGLIQGYLTDPFACRDRERITETHGYDLDPARGKVRDYRGETAMEYGSGGRTADGHQAVDWGNSNRNVIGITVRAAAPGIVVFAGEDATLHGNCRMVTLAHPYSGHKTGYVHLEEILVEDGQELKRGQILGTLGDSCTDWPHLHFTFNPGWDSQEQDWSNKDPFRDTQDPGSYTWWTADNQPVCLDFNK